MEVGCFVFNAAFKDGTCCEPCVFFVFVPQISLSIHCFPSGLGHADLQGIPWQHFQIF